VDRFVTCLVFGGVIGTRGGKCKGCAVRGLSLFVCVLLIISTYFVCGCGSVVRF